MEAAISVASIEGVKYGARGGNGDVACECTSAICNLYESSGRIASRCALPAEGIPTSAVGLATDALVGAIWRGQQAGTCRNQLDTALVEVPDCDRRREQ